MRSIVIAGFARSPFTLANKGGGRYALATQCIGGGQAIATILERI